MSKKTASAPIDPTLPLPTPKKEFTIVTRKIQIAVDESDVEMKRGYYKSLHDYAYQCVKSANIGMSQAFILDMQRYFKYLTEDANLQLLDNAKNSEGILTTSYQNTFYKVIRDEVKPQKMPSVIYSALSSKVFAKFNADRNAVLKGDKSMASFKKGMPVPFTKAISHLRLNEEYGSFNFKMFGIQFFTMLGRDLSGNRVIIERIISGEYELADSSYQFQKKEGRKEKLFLLLCVKIPKSDIALDSSREARAKLDINFPIIATFDKRNYEHIGTKEDYLHKRLHIQAGLRNMQMACKENRGGRGRAKKMKPVDRWEAKEYNYIHTKLHTYSKRLINFCLNNNCGTLVIQTVKEEKLKTKQSNAPKTYGKSNKDMTEEEISFYREQKALEQQEFDDKQFVLRNWNYYGLMELIKYKAKMHNITITHEDIKPLLAA